MSAKRGRAFDHQCDPQRRGRSADRCRQGQPVGSQGCHHDPCRLPPRHGLRSSELEDLRWDQIDFTHAVLHVRRAKKGTPAEGESARDGERAWTSHRLG